MDETDKGYFASEHPELVGKLSGTRCPNGHPFKIRVNRDTDELFLGCSEYPNCRETDEISVTLMMRLEGHAQLPGFD